MKRAGTTFVLLLHLVGATARAQDENETGGARYEPRDETTIREALAAVFAEDELLPVARRAGFGETQPSPPEPEPATSEETEGGFWSWLRDLLDRWTANAPAEPLAVPVGGALAYGVYALGALLLLAVVAAIARGIWQRWRAERQRAEADAALATASEIEPPGARSADEYLKRATEAASQGDYRAALSALLLGAMSWAERRGLVRHRKGLTNWDYLAAVVALPDAREAFARIVDHFERVHYGRRPATEEAVRECLGIYRRRFAAG